MPARQAGPRTFERHRHRLIGQQRQVVGQPLHGQAAIEVAQQQAEQRRMMAVAQQVHLAFDVARVRGQLHAHVGAPLYPVGQIELALADALVEQFVQQDRMAHQVVGGPAAGRQQAQHAVEGAAVLVQQRHVGAALGHHVEQLREARQHLVGADVVDRARLRVALADRVDRALDEPLDRLPCGLAGGLHAA